MGALIDIATEDGLERGAKVIGPSDSGDVSQRRVEFKDGVVDDWDVADFRKPWAAGDVVDIDTEDGWERGATVSGLATAGTHRNYVSNFKMEQLMTGQQTIFASS